MIFSFFSPFRARRENASIFLLLILICLSKTASAFSWQDLWLTHDQQAKALMNKGDFAKARDTFERKDWRATSAYRAEDYATAAKLYASDKNEEDFYNEGNALAHMGKYEQAIKAYDKALAINPHHQDATYNRKIVEELLKKDKQDQNKQDQDKQDQNKQDQNKQDQGKQDQGKQDQNKQDQNKQDQNKQDQDKQDQDKQTQNKQDQDKQDQDKQKKEKQDKEQQNQNKKDTETNDQQKSEPKPTQSQKEQKEEQQENEQWLRLIPDDPGGLLRQKFLRDHLRRQNGWNQ